MAIPTQYSDSPNSIGDSNVKHPIYTFRVLMNRRSEESVGPLTNQRTGSVLHPDRYDSDSDRGAENSENHETQFSPYVPGFLAGDNVVRNDDGTFTVYGLRGKYLKEQYADIENPLLQLTNSAPYTSA